MPIGRKKLEISEESGLLVEHLNHQVDFEKDSEESKIIIITAAKICKSYFLPLHT